MTGRRGDQQDRVKDTLIRRMTSGKLRAGDTVPPKADLARESGVSAFAVAGALGSLTAEGLIAFEQGLGYFVTMKGAALAEEGGQP